MVRALVSHRCGPGSNPAVVAIYGWRLLLVLFLALRGLVFFWRGGWGWGRGVGGTPFYSSPQKQTRTNYIQFDLERTSY